MSPSPIPRSFTVIYHGPADKTHQRLTPGVHLATSLQERSWTLHITEHGTTVQAIEDRLDDSTAFPVHLLQQALTALTAWADLTGRAPASDLAVYDHLRTTAVDLRSSPEEAFHRLVTDRWQLNDAREAHQQYVHDAVADALKARGLSRR